jgi:GT2 family glycosyltransferase
MFARKGFNKAQDFILATICKHVYHQWVQDVANTSNNVMEELLAHNPEIICSILNYNGRDDTLLCLDEILNTPAVEVLPIVVENGSSRSEKDAILDQLRKKYSINCTDVTDHKFTTLRWILFESDNRQFAFLDSARNMGFCVGNNLVGAIGSVLNIKNLLLMNNDSFPEQGCLHILTNSISECDKLVALSPKICDMDGQNWYLGGSISDVEYEYQTDLSKSTKYCQTTDGIGIYSTEMYSGSTVLFDLEVFSQLGGLLHALFISFDEPEFSRRLRSKGYRIGVVPDAVARHDVSQTVGEPGSRIHEYFYQRNGLIFVT